MASQLPPEVVTVKRKEVKLKDLDDDLMKRWLSKMSITEQTAVTRVCKRFKNNAYHLTTVMNADELPEALKYEILFDMERRVARMPKLKTVNFIVIVNPTPQRLKAIKIVLETVALTNPNVERLIGVPKMFYDFFVRKCKEYHADYNGSKFKGSLTEYQYEELSKVYTDVKLRYETDIFDDVLQSSSSKARLLDPNLSVLKLNVESGNYVPLDLLATTEHLSELKIYLASVTSKPKYSPIFNAVAKLRHLKKFNLAMDTDVPGKSYGWVKGDIDSFKVLLQVDSLKHIIMVVPIGHQTYLKVLKCFLDCPRNNFHHFSVGSASSGYDLDVSPFHTTCNLSQLFPSMFMCLREESGINDSFPMAEFIQKFSPKHREFLFLHRFTMMKMINSCLDLIENQPKVHFVFYAADDNGFMLTFRPVQLEPERIKFSAELGPRQHRNVHYYGQEYPDIDPRQLEVLRFNIHQDL